MSTHISVISYALAAMAYLVLTGLSLTVWRNRMPSKLLVLACLVSALWSGLVAYQAAHGYQATLASDLLELARNGAWTFFLLILLVLSGKERGLPPQSQASNGLSCCPIFLAHSGMIYSYFGAHYYADPGFPWVDGFSERRCRARDDGDYWHGTGRTALPQRPYNQRWVSYSCALASAGCSPTIFFCIAKPCCSGAWTSDYGVPEE